MTTFSKIIGGVTLAVAAAVLTVPAFTAASAVADCCCGKDCKCTECGCAGGFCTNCQCDACDCTGCACGEDCGSPCCVTSQEAVKADGCCSDKAGKAGDCCDNSPEKK